MTNNCLHVFNAAVAPERDYKIVQRDPKRFNNDLNYPIGYTIFQCDPVVRIGFILMGIKRFDLGIRLRTFV